ncbi:DUF4810 domain-containing protein [Maricaulis salignorans]|uniref:DUF4810 domain-containing protein n=1 Tax=Maricaulis salignorans TaxID=144026 RepID=UPI003A8DB6B6
MIKFICVAVTALAVTACAVPSRFEWGGYEQGLYDYYRNPENSDNYIRTLERAIERGDATDRTAPGLNAELGYIHLGRGDTQLAETYFRREMELFPESAAFLSRFLGTSASANLNGNTVDIDSEATS